MTPTPLVEDASAFRQDPFHRPSVDSVLAFYTRSSATSPRFSPSAPPPLPTNADATSGEASASRAANAASLSSARRLSHRISQDFVRPADDPPLIQMRAGDSRANSLHRRSKRISPTESPVAEAGPPPVLANARRQKHVSASPSLYSSARTPAPSQDDMAYRRHSIAHASSDKLEGPEGAGVPSLVLPNEAGQDALRPGSIARVTTPIPHNPPPFLRPASGAGEPPRILRPIHIPAAGERNSMLSSNRRSGGTGSNRNSVMSIDRPVSLAKSANSLSPTALRISSRPMSGTMDGDIARNSVVEPSPNVRFDEASNLDQAAPQLASDGAQTTEAIRWDPSFGSPAFAVPQTVFPLPEALDRRRSSSSLRSLRKASFDGSDPEAEKEWKERTERRRSRSRKTKSETWGDQLKTMLESGQWPEPVPDGLADPLSSRHAHNNTLPSNLSSPVEAPDSPLQELISSLSGRRQSHASTYYDETRSPSYFSSRGSTALTSVAPYPELGVTKEDPSENMENNRDGLYRSDEAEVVEEMEEEAQEGEDEDDDLTATQSQQTTDRPPSAPPVMSLPSTPIGMPDSSYDQAAREHTDYETALEDPDDEQEVLSDQDRTVTLNTDRTLTLDEMEREIARMEAELALNGRSAADPGQSPAPSYTSSTFASALQNIPITSPLKTSTSAGLSAPLLERAASQGSNLSELTPQTARQWSMGEMERAYQRMRGMLGSTRSFALSELDLNLAGDEALKGLAIPDLDRTADEDDTTPHIG